jgi:hypothetical protein
MKMWTTLMAAGLAFMSSCTTGGQVNGSTTADSIILYKKDSLLAIGSLPSVLQCHFTQQNATLYKSGLTTLLVLADPLQLAPPDGVYEVYLTDHAPGTDKLSASQTGFVSVLDLYSHTAPGAKKQIAIDISGHINKIFAQQHTPFSAWISIRFGPVQFADGTYSANGGELHFKGFSIIQVKK